MRHGRGMIRSGREVAGSGLTVGEVTFVVLSLMVFAGIVMVGTDFVQPYEHGIQVGYVFIDWHYLVNADARTELGG